MIDIFSHTDSSLWRDALFLVSLILHDNLWNSWNANFSFSIANLAHLRQEADTSPLLLSDKCPVINSYDDRIDWWYRIIIVNLSIIIHRALDTRPVLVFMTSWLSDILSCPSLSQTKSDWSLSSCVRIFLYDCVVSFLCHYVWRWSSCLCSLRSCMYHPN